MFLGKLVIASVLVVFANSVCIHNSSCREARGVVKHSSTNVSAFENLSYGQRWWNIQPQNTNGHVILAFQNFRSSSNAIMTVRIYKLNGQHEIEYYTGEWGNFEIIKKGVRNVLVIVPLGVTRATNFTLHYYGDCEIADSIPITSTGARNPTKCWAIVPSQSGMVNRIYLTLRDIILADGSQLQFKDIHSTEVIEVIEADVSYETLAIDTRNSLRSSNSYCILLDFTCANEACNYADNNFIISYYTMSNEDIWCIEVQKECSRNRSDIPIEWCDVPCPAFHAMLEQEYTMEVRETQFSVVRTGEVTKDPKTQRRLSVPNRVRCPIDPRMCQCDKDPNNFGEFCTSPRKCFEYGGCMWRCIFVKVTRCLKILFLKAVVLL